MKKTAKVILVILVVIILLCLVFSAFLGFYRTTKRTLTDFDYLIEGESTIYDMSLLHSIYPCTMYSWGGIYEYPTAEGQYIHVQLDGIIVESICVDNWSLANSAPLPGK